ncbi:sigma-54 dependent transcriptional regulator [bacterium]|nr:sigma-54 dependent transcriptional regulator [bacterium]MBU1024465.1 sigma-54 dependent transcriptional regulator [bacterium]
MATRKNKENILVVDDSEITLEVIERNLSREGYRVFTAGNAGDAINIIEQTPVDLVITDLKMPRVSGLELIRHLRENYKNTEVMMITGYATVEGAVMAVKAGAEEYLSKPFTDEELLRAVQTALEKLHMRRTLQVPLKMASSESYGIIGNSEGLRKVFTVIEKAASSKATVLIYGESGTGKELVARAIHYSSPRASSTFVPVNCGGIPESLLESELFGHLKGAFTGANETRAGFFLTADGGTIFLDEVGEMSLAMQVKLLRVLEDKEICMLGSTKSSRIDVRILAATNKDLLKLVENGSFREDLYYRLNVLNLAIPPLRERGEDILILTNHFIRKFSECSGKEQISFSDEALGVLMNYFWPGNVRELENLIQRLVVMTDSDIIDITDFPSLMRFSANKICNLDRSLAEMESEHIKNVLSSVDGNKSKASKILGIDRKTLREKLKTFKI